MALGSTLEMSAVPADPVTTFLVQYSDYILFGIGLFLLIWGANTYYQNKIKAKDELKIIDQNPGDDGGDQ